MNKYNLTLIAFIGFLNVACAQMFPLRNASGLPLTSQPYIIHKYSMFMNVPPDSIKNIKLYMAVEQFSSTHYKLGGNDPDGVDCSGFTCAVEQQAFGLTIPRSTSGQLAMAKLRTLANVKPGDLVFLKSHTVGLYLQNGFFVEVISNGGLVLNNANDPNQQERIAGFGAMK